MTHKIAIASGKGGTGKTTLSVNLYHYLGNSAGKKVQLVDCDVEEPNDIIFFPEAQNVEENEVFQLIPVIDREKCTYCRKCVSYCEFNAIVVIPPIKFAEVNAGLCHSCGACSVACMEKAISEKQEQIGKISFYKIKEGITVMEGKLKIGSAMQTMLIKELKKNVSEEPDIVIYDAPPGTSCPVVETLSDADYIVLVTEPTPFGLHDLKLMVELLSGIQKPFGVIVNKSGLGSNSIYDYISNNGIELLGDIPFNEEYAACYATGNLFGSIPREIRICYTQIIEKIEQKILMHEGNNRIKW